MTPGIPQVETWSAKIHLRSCEIFHPIATHDVAVGSRRIALTMAVHSSFVSPHSL